MVALMLKPRKIKRIYYKKNLKVSGDIEAVSEFYQINHQKAQDYIKFLPKEKI
jgi:hypothetical protein